jgi:hypothetical protein
LQPLLKRYMIRTTGTEPRLLKSREVNIWSEEGSLDFREQSLSRSEHLLLRSEEDK